MSKKIFILFLFCILFQSDSKAQQPEAPGITLSDSCHWDKVATKTKKNLINKKGIVYERFGITVINIRGKAYNACSLPSNLAGKKVLISGAIYTIAKADGTPIKLTALKLLPD